MQDDSMARENLYWDMQDIEKEVAESIRRIADMAFKRMTLEKALCLEEHWTAGYEERRLQLGDLSKNDCLSKRAARLDALNEARQWLENYGGSPQRKKRGLGILATAIEHAMKEGR